MMYIHVPEPHNNYAIKSMYLLFVYHQQKEGTQILVYRLLLLLLLQCERHVVHVSWREDPVGDSHGL